MTKLQILFSSPAFYTIIGVFLFNGLQAVVPLLQGDGQTVVNVVLLALTAYLHASNVQVAQGVARAQGVEQPPVPSQQ